MVREKRQAKQKEEQEKKERAAHEQSERELREYREQQMRECRERAEAKREKEKRRQAERKKKKRAKETEEKRMAEEKKRAEEKSRASTQQTTDEPQSPVLNLPRLLRGGGPTALAKQSPRPTTRGSSHPASADASTQHPTSEPSTSSEVTDRNRASLGLRPPASPPRPTGPSDLDTRVEISRPPPPMNQHPRRPILPLMALRIPRPPELGPEPSAPLQEPQKPRRR